ncbi:MAG TPA: hypothetical protein VI702_06760 [Nitrospiria bacterium]
MLAKALSIAPFVGFVLILLGGCYGSQTAEMCLSCQSHKEGKADGEEWTAEYINSKFQCKLEGGQLKVKAGDTWAACK